MWGTSASVYFINDVNMFICCFQCVEYHHYCSTFHYCCKYVHFLFSVCEVPVLQYILLLMYICSFVIFRICSFVIFSEWSTSAAVYLYDGVTFER